ncbi:hypothetical protein PC129_g10237 [Phytophthora cactorum]|uniref:Uncharacterized protein n=1 Tax=Phytophthora cactorum TaxID=29920 RepID=A0A329SBU3_9STRA|nr:hypothetical protein Pcac1_g1258 [Phytophthora cactorum]KAG2799007.1 hypothetical protein PC112_g21100 [Phytophthora cactorum]KAG2881408.1 hypothetical protein PC115_g22242 [Phytophthora cactorum]KAG2888741.1 hypothetical protein PC117_g24846 [Phytophthora cactorum]KAG2894397.1 hypothetical protein PC114_g15928 [Phytophthora cactorum]
MARLTQRHIKKTNETNPVSSASTWKALARYQQEELQYANETHKQLLLVAAVSSPASLIQELREIMLNRVETTPPINEKVHDVRVMNARKDEILIGTQISELEANYLRTNKCDV